MPAKHSSLTQAQRWEFIYRFLNRQVPLTTGEIGTLLAAEGYATSARTLQRDLILLETIGCVESTGQHNAKAWRWTRAITKWLPSPVRDSSQAVAWKLVDAHLKRLLPEAVTESLAPFFAAANQGVTRREQEWLKRVRVIPTGFALQAPAIDRRVHARVCDALYHQRQLKFDYRKGGTDLARTYQGVNPLGLVEQDGVLTLVATHAGSDGEPRQFQLHRIVPAPGLADEAARVPIGFDLDRYIAAGQFSFGNGRQRRIKLRVDGWVYRKLRETPLSADQKFRKHWQGGQWIVTATVPDCDAFEWWLRSLGEAATLID